MGHRNRWLWLAVGIQVTLVAPARAPAGAPVHMATWEGTRCRVDLEADREDGVLRLRPRCPLSWEEAEQALAGTLSRLHDLGEPPSRYRSLFLGRLVDYPWMSKGLARWAARSPEWDARRGRPRGERNGNAFVERALGAAGMLVPLADALAAHGLRVAGVSAEKTLILPVSELSFGSDLRNEGLADDTRLPYDAMVHLVLADHRAGLAPPKPE